MRVPVAFVFSLAIIAQAGKALPENQPSIAICMDSGPASGFPLTHAESTAARMFSAIGIHLDWHHGGHGCKLPIEGTIHISMSTSSRPEDYPGALAIARLGDEAHRIEVFYDRVTETVEERLVSSLLAHVLVHEITHVIEGLNRHSDEGVMKARWSEPEYREMAFEPLGFAAEDIALLHQRIGTVESAQTWFTHGRSVTGLRSGSGSTAFAPPAASAPSKVSIVP
jgi:hypothetical protein